LDAELDALGGSSDARNEPMDSMKEATNVSNELIDTEKGATDVIKETINSDGELKDATDVDGESIQEAVGHPQKPPAAARSLTTEIRIPTTELIQSPPEQLLPRLPKRLSDITMVSAFLM
jgi:hypothetical protein